MAIDKEVISMDTETLNHVAAVLDEFIERETGVTELLAENKRLRSAANDTENYHSIACQELENANKKLAALQREVASYRKNALDACAERDAMQEHADALAKVLSHLVACREGCGKDRLIYCGGDGQLQLLDDAINECRAALAAYKKDKL